MSRQQGFQVHRGPLQTNPCQTESALGGLDISIDAPQTQDEPEGLCICDQERVDFGLNSCCSHKNISIQQHIQYNERIGMQRKFF